VNVRDTNPFQAPASELRESALPNGSPLLAIIVGVVIDVGGTVALSIVMLIAWLNRAMALMSFGAVKCRFEVQTAFWLDTSKR